MSLGIDAQKVTLYEKSRLPNAFDKVGVMKKHYYTSSQFINCMNLYKQTNKKRQLSHSDLVKSGWIIYTLRRFHILFSLPDNLTNITEIYLLIKKSESFSRLKKYSAKPKIEDNCIQRFRISNDSEFDLAACKKSIDKEGIQ